MHVLANGEYSIGGFVFERLIPSFTNLVFLFMMVSDFGMCCGYYQKIIDQKISVEDFYKKRYIKIWPYFTLLCALDFMMSPSKESLFEVFANLTLCQGLPVSYTHLDVYKRQEDMIRDIRNLKAALGVLEENQREEKETGRYIDQLNKKIFDGQPCGNNCIYNPGQFL